MLLHQCVVTVDVPDGAPGAATAAMAFFATYCGADV